MALVLGTNCGFVTSAPSADPTGGIRQDIDGWAYAQKDTSPSGTYLITEIGIWVDNDTPECNFEVGLYDHDSGDDEPNNLLQSDKINIKTTGSEWKRVTGLNWEIDSDTIYWIAAAMENNTQTSIDLQSGAGNCARKGPEVDTLPDPAWGDSTSNLSYAVAIYAVVEEAATGTNTQINIGDSWKDISEIQINI